MRVPIMSLLIALITVSSGQTESVLSIDVERIDFGRVPQNSNFYRKIVLRSVGDETLKITKINTFCKCIKMPLERNLIPPGDSIIVELSFFSSTDVGRREWRPHIYTNARGKTRKVYIRLTAFIIASVEKQKPIYVSPHTINASQFGDSLIAEFPIQIINKSEENVPLKLLNTDDEFFDLDFPVYIAPKDTAFGKVILNEKGRKSEFEKSITFEYIDEKSEKEHYSIPVRRKIFKHNQ